MGVDRVDHPYVTQALQKYSGQQIEGLGLSVQSAEFSGNWFLAYQFTR